MANAAYSINMNIGGIQMNQAYTRSGDHPNPYTPSIPAASSATIVNRTNDALTDVTLLANHGLTNGTYDCFFSAGVKYAITATITANVMTLTSGSGDAFPVNTTSCQVSKVTQVNTQIDGDNVKIIGMCLVDPSSGSTEVAHVQMLDSGDATIAEIDLVANVPRIWDITGGDANAFTGNPITYSQVAQSKTTGALTVQIVSLEDATP